MKHVPIPTKVSPAAIGGVRLARVLCAAMAALLVVAGPAMAQRQERGGEPRMQDMRAQPDPRQLPPPERVQRFEPRAFDSREFDDRRMQQEAAARAQEARRSGRLTPDERRDLRRQINEAGMDLYSRPQHR